MEVGREDGREDGKEGGVCFSWTKKELGGTALVYTGQGNLPPPAHCALSGLFSSERGLVREV